MTVCEKYKARHVIIPLLRTFGNTIDEIKSEVAYRKSCVNSNGAYKNASLKGYTIDELIGAETMWNEV